MLYHLEIRIFSAKKTILKKEILVETQNLLSKIPDWYIDLISKRSVYNSIFQNYLEFGFLICPFLGPQLQQVHQKTANRGHALTFWALPRPLKNEKSAQKPPKINIHPVSYLLYFFTACISMVFSQTRISLLYISFWVFYINKCTCLVWKYLIFWPQSQDKIEFRCKLNNAICLKI